MNAPSCEDGPVKLQRGPNSIDAEQGKSSSETFIESATVWTLKQDCPLHAEGVQRVLDYLVWASIYSLKAEGEGIRLHSVRIALHLNGL